MDIAWALLYSAKAHDQEKLKGATAEKDGGDLARSGPRGKLRNPELPRAGASNARDLAVVLLIGASHVPGYLASTAA